MVTPQKILCNMTRVIWHKCYRQLIQYGTLKTWHVSEEIWYCMTNFTENIVQCNPWPLGQVSRKNLSVGDVHKEILYCVTSDIGNFVYSDTFHSKFCTMWHVSQELCTMWHLSVELFFSLASVTEILYSVNYVRAKFLQCDMCHRKNFFVVTRVRENVLQVETWNNKFVTVCQVPQDILHCVNWTVWHLPTWGSVATHFSSMISEYLYTSHCKILKERHVSILSPVKRPGVERDSGPYGYVWKEILDNISRANLDTSGTKFWTVWQVWIWKRAKGQFENSTTFVCVNMDMYKY